MITPAVMLAQDATRLAALRSFAILDTPAEPLFDDITLIASMICQTPIALVSLVDAERQWFKSKVGIEATETPVTSSFCAHAALSRDLLIVPDTFRDERFRENPLVVGEPGIRYYAGAPLISHDGHALGTVCVIDRRPRLLHQDQLKALQALARQTVALLELRKALAQLTELQNPSPR